MRTTRLEWKQVPLIILGGALVLLLAFSFYYFKPQDYQQTIKQYVEQIETKKTSKEQELARYADEKSKAEAAQQVQQLDKMVTALQTEDFVAANQLMKADYESGHSIAAPKLFNSLFTFTEYGDTRNNLYPTEGKFLQTVVEEKINATDAIAQQTSSLNKLAQLFQLTGSAGGNLNANSYLITYPAKTPSFAALFLIFVGVYLSVAFTREKRETVDSLVNVLPIKRRTFFWSKMFVSFVSLLALFGLFLLLFLLLPLFFGSQLGSPHFPLIYRVLNTILAYPLENVLVSYCGIMVIWIIFFLCLSWCLSLFIKNPLIISGVVAVIIFFDLLGLSRLKWIETIAAWLPMQYIAIGDLILKRGIFDKTATLFGVAVLLGWSAVFLFISALVIHRRQRI